MAGVLLTGSAFAAPVQVPDADKERAAAVEAMKKGDLDGSVLHYENILDSTKTDQLTRIQLRSKIAEYKPLIAPNTDPAKAGVWKCKAFVIRTLDYKYKDKEGREHHAIHTFTNEEIEGFRSAMKGFQDLVWKFTAGNLRIEWDLQVLERTITTLSYDETWGYCPWATMTMPVVTDQLKYGEADTVMVYVKMWKGKGETSESVPCRFLADCSGVQPCTKGSTYIIFNSDGAQCGDPSGETQLHEWLHAVDMAMSWVHNYPKEGSMDWTSDGGDYEISSGCYKLQPTEKGWMPVYLHQMRDHVTRKMWRECSIFQKADNVWLNDYVRDYLVLGSFSGEGKPLGGLNQSFIDEKNTVPKLGAKVGGMEWKLASAPGKYPNFAAILGTTEANQNCYAAFAIESDKDQVAVIRTQRDGGCKMWQDGKLILDSPQNRAWDTDPNVIDVNLKKGKNVFLIKLNNFTCDWAFNLKVTGTDNNSLPGVKFTLP